MLVIFDQITATLVGGIVILLLFSLQIRVQSATVEDTVLYTAKNQTLSFAEVLERDLANTGFMTVPGQAPIDFHEDDSTYGEHFTKLFQFWGVDADGNRVQVKYETTVLDTAQVQGETVNVFQVTRFEDDGTGWTNAGASTPTLSAFNIDLLDNNNNGATIANARKLRVRFENLVGQAGGSVAGKTGSYLRELRWGITLTPRGLRLQDFQG